MASLLTATICHATGAPREGYQVVLWSAVPVLAMTDAGGGIVVDVEPGTYRLALETALQVDGVAYPAGTVLVIEVPAEDARLGDCVTEVIDASPIALLDRIVALEGKVP